eukprot:12290885-Alexandrium_andersonii.AAC.1
MCIRDRPTSLRGAGLVTGYLQEPELSRRPRAILAQEHRAAPVGVRDADAQARGAKRRAHFA